MDWVMSNKEWIFSGIGVFILAAAGRWFVKRRRATKINQTQSSGTNSNNYQSAGDLNVNIGENPDV